MNLVLALAAAVLVIAFWRQVLIVLVLVVLSLMILGVQQVVDKSTSGPAVVDPGAGHEATIVRMV